MEDTIKINREKHIILLCMYRVGSQTRYSCGTLFKQTTTLNDIDRFLYNMLLKMCAVLMVVM